MKIISSQRGYALIIVLALITIITILMVPYLNSFLHDTQEIKIETVKNQNTYTLESAVEITRAIIEENNIMREEELSEIISEISNNGSLIFDENISGTIDLDNNQIVFETNDTYSNERAESKITLVYRTYDSSVFYDNPIFIGDKNNPEKKIKGNDKFRDSFSNYTIVSGSEELFELLVANMVLNFEEGFNPNIDSYYEKWDLDEPVEDSLFFHNLWINDSASIDGKGNVDLIVDGDFYVAGDLSLSKFNNVIINGDLVVYNGSLDISNIDMIDVKGSIIVNGMLKIIGNPKIIVGNLSAKEIQVNSKNDNVFYLFEQEEAGDDNITKDKNKKKKKDDKDKDDGQNNGNIEFLDGQLEIENWKFE